MGRSSCFVVLVLGVLFCLENTESVPVQHYDCWKPRDGQTCTIHSVNIDPCPNSVQKDNKPVTACEIVRGANITGVLTFDYTPEFNSTTVLGQAHKSEMLQDIPWVDMDTDACKFTKCPLVAGVRNTYTFPVTTKGDYPAGAYTVKWKLWNENEPIKQACCLKLKVVFV